jgi:hypothetical protein
MVLQFVVFPPIARNFGVLNSLRVCTVLYPLAYILTPFAVLMPTSTTRQGAIFCVMLIKCLAGVFAFPCTTILLTNSARSLRLLGTLNGVSTSISAIGRACGPFVSGTAFTYGIDVGYMIIPWWTLAIFGILGHIPTWWLIEMEGFGAHDDESEASSSQQGGSSTPASTGDPEADETADLITKTNNYAASLDRRSPSITPIDEEQEEENESTALLSSSHPNRLYKSTSHSSYRSYRSVLSESSSTAPIGMRRSVAGKSRKLSSNLGLSEGLGRTMLGGGFGTRGPEYFGTSSEGTSKDRTLR